MFESRKRGSYSKGKEGNVREGQKQNLVLLLLGVLFLVFQLCTGCCATCVLALRRRDDLDLHRRRRERRELLGHALAGARVSAAAAEASAAARAASAAWRFRSTSAAASLFL